MAIRAFVAANLDPDCRAALLQQMAPLQAEFPNVAWVRPDQLHITLAFLGNLEDSRVPAAAEACRLAAGRHRAFEMRLAGLGAFPSWKRPRVFWLGLAEGGEALAGLQRELADELSGRAFLLETRAFVPHLTLGRVKEGRGRLPWPESWPLTLPAAGSRLASLELMQSQLKSAGAVYSVLGSCPLRSAA